GLGQYYKVPLGVLGLLREDEQRRVPDRQLTTYAGLRVAQSVDVQAAFGGLIEVANAGAARATDLARLGEEINPSAILPGSEDDDLCRGQDLGRGQARRETLLLALRYLADCVRLEGEGEFPKHFRWACSEMALPDGKPWRLPEPMRETARAWSAYQRNDVVNY